MIEPTQASGNGSPLRRGGCARVALFVLATVFGGLIIAVGTGTGFGVHLLSSSLEPDSWLGRGLAALIVFVGFVLSMATGTVGIALFDRQPASDAARAFTAVIGAAIALAVASQLAFPIAIFAGGVAAWVYSANSSAAAGLITGIATPLVGVLFVLIGIYDNSDQN